MPKNYRFFLLFIMTMLALFFGMGMQDYMSLRPQGPHQWRQADCLSFTLNYTEQNNGILEPELHNQMGYNGENGKSAGEFPIVYYFMGKVWKVTGQQEWLFRLVNLLLFLAALFALSLLLYKKTGSQTMALFFAGLIFTIPVLSYYAPNFLMNITALSLVLLGWFFAVSFYDDAKLWKGILAVLLFALAPLLKITAFISILALGGVLGLHLLFPKLKLLKKLPLKVWLVAGLGLFLSISLAGLWYNYAREYNTTFGGWFTFNDMWPIWQADGALLRETADFVAHVWVREYFTPLGYLMLIFSIGVLIYYFKSIPAFFKAMLLFVFLGNFLYVMLWFKALRDHDYYVINLYALPFLIWFVALWRIKQQIVKNSMTKMFGVLAMGIALTASALYTNFHLYLRYNGWMNDGGQNKHASFFDITPYLRNEIKLTREDKVITYPDPSYSITLYLANQKGWPMPLEQNADFVAEKIKFGAKYILVNDSSFYTKEGLDQFHLTKIGQHKNVTILKIE